MKIATMQVTRILLSSAVMFSVLAAAGGRAFAGSAALRAAASIEIADSKGKFDFLRIDTKRHRLLAAHENDGTADYIDLTRNSLIARVKVGGAVDTAVDPGSKYYYVSVQAAKRVAVVDAATLKEVKSIPLEGESDAIIYEPKNGLVYVTHDEGANVWVIDPQAAKVIGSITVPGVPEFMLYDDSTDRIYLNIKSADKVAVIDPAANKTVAEWSTAPASLPHGMALDAAHHRIFTAGGGGKLAVIDTSTGRVIDSAAIAPKVDQIAFDVAAQRLYCAGAAKMTILDTSGPKVAVAGELSTAETAKNVAVDPDTHAVWTTYTDGKSSFAKSWIQ
jgi:DNA-binding beta-propeller fold protein YncE